MDLLGVCVLRWFGQCGINEWISKVRNRLMNGE